MIEPSSFPRRINLELTNHCNQRCPLCPRQGLTRPLGFMDAALFEKIARECAPHPTRLWLHFLGEPLLHRDVAQLVRRAKDLGVAEVGLSTNGVSLGTHADALIDAGLDRLECSLDADDRDGYARMRGRDHFARVVANVRDFLARKRARGVVKPVTSIQFMRTPEVEARLADIVSGWRPHLGAGDFVMTIRPASFLGAIPVDAGLASGAREPCAWLFQSLMVLQDGTVTMCGADWDASLPLGNARDASLAEIWNGPELERRRRAHLTGDFAAVVPCGSCNDWRLATGDGYRNALAEVDEKSAD